MTYSLENINITNENGLNLQTYSNMRCMNDNSSNHYFMTDKNEAFINKDKNSNLIKIYSNSKAEYLINPLNKCNIKNLIDNNTTKNKLFRINQSSRKSGYDKELNNKKDMLSSIEKKKIEELWLDDLTSFEKEYDWNILEPRIKRCSEVTVDKRKVLRPNY